MVNQDSFNEFRKKHIGASDIPIIMGLSPWNDSMYLWQLKIGQIEPEEPNERMKRGVAMEPSAREAYIAQTGNIVAPMDNIIWKEWDIASCSLDGVNMNGELIIEIKCPYGSKTLVLAKEGKIEKNYYAQVQWQLMISKANVCHFWVWHPEKGNALLMIDSNLEFQKLALQSAKKFWEAVNSDFSPDPNFLSQEIKACLDKVEIVAKPDREYIEIKEPTALKKKEKWKEVKAAVDEAKMILKELEVTLDDIEHELIDETDGGNCIVGDVKICYFPSTKITDWKKAKEGLNISDEALIPYLKDKKPFYKVSLIEKTLGF